MTAVESISSCAENLQVCELAILGFSEACLEVIQGQVRHRVLQIVEIHGYEVLESGGRSATKDKKVQSGSGMR